MPRGYDTTRSWLLQGIIAALAALWVWEFLPVLERLHLLVDAQSFLPLLVALALFQLVPFLAIRVVGGLLASGWYVWHYFQPAHVSWNVGLHELAVTMVQQVTQLLHQQPLVDPLQTTLFTLVLSALYWLVVYSARRQRLWLFYNGLAVIVLALVDGNTSVQPNQALLVILATALLVLGLNHFASLGSAAPAQARPAKARFFVPLGAVIAAIFALAAVLPKQAAVWADPFQGGNGQGVGTTSGESQLVIGYQSNNAHLGGSFAMNYEPVLSVVTKYPTYLRGESYSTYTGKGWLHTTLARDPITPQVPIQLQPTAAFAGLASQAVTQKVQVLSGHLNVNVLFGSYAINKVTANQAGAGFQSGLFVNPMNGNVYSSENLTLNQTYAVTSQELEDPSAPLSEAPPGRPSTSDYPAEVQQLYLQLPPNLPARISTLAQQVTAQDVSEYDKVVGIETYLQEHYTYATQGIPVPGPGQDYVDQFLFDSSRGYCNNFSSSMAVMLRTLDIPTRWVTGFTYGKQDLSYTGLESRFVIRNADAHSWVEVYFPQEGWVPFDPTPNFLMPFAPAPSSASGAQVTPPATKATPAVKKPVQPQPTQPQGAAGPTTGWGMVARVGEWTLLVLLSTLLAAGLLFRRRLYFARLWQGMSPNALGRAMTYLVRLLERKRSLPSPAPTLRELMPVARTYGVPEQEYRQFVRTAEKVWYAGEAVPVETMEQARRTWMGWITRLNKQKRSRKQKVKK